MGVGRPESRTTRKRNIVGFLRRIDNKGKRKRMANKGLVFERVADGVVFDGLSPGLHEISGEFRQELVAMSDEGGFWPYRIVVIGANYKRNIFLIRIEEIP